MAALKKPKCTRYSAGGEGLDAVKTPDLKSFIRKFYFDKVNVNDRREVICNFLQEKIELEEIEIVDHKLKKKEKEQVKKVAEPSKKSPVKKTVEPSKKSPVKKTVEPSKKS